MKKPFLKILSLLVITAVLIGILNAEVSIKQGRDYKIYTVKMPLYLKLFDFFDRHYNYIRLEKQITAGAKTDEEKVLRIFEWTHRNIKPAPEGYPIIDDHVWSIIVRGYGVGDQFSDVFTTLCNYSGIEAFFSAMYAQDRRKQMTLSFCRLKTGWAIFDPYHGVYFKNKDGIIATVDEIKKENWEAIYIDDAGRGTDFKSLFNDLGNIKGIGLNRANIQSPLRRLMFAVKEALGLVPKEAY